MPFILVDYQNNTEAMIPEGIMGLSNYKKIPNLFDLAYQKNQLISSIIGFKLGIDELNQKSYFYFNISQEEASNATFVKTTRNDSWMIQIRDFTINGKKYNLTEALIDTGTSDIILPPKLYDQIDRDFFSKFCEPYNSQKWRKCECPSNENEYPNITLISSTIAFDITQQSYLKWNLKRRACALSVEKIQNDIDFMILGAAFLHQHEVYFDKTNSRVGFIKNYRVPKLYIDSQQVNIALNAVTVGAVFGVFLITFFKKKKNSKMLSEPLNVTKSI